MSLKLIVGCGYLGRRVAALWSRQGQHFLATTRRATRFDELQVLGAQPIQCDVLERASLYQLPAVETLLYCVGLDRAAGHSMREVYVEGLANLLDVLAEAKKLPPRFVHVSSTSVYGQTGGEKVDETAATEPKEESGRVVLEAERVLRDRLPPAIVLRFAGIYGPERLLRSKAIQAGEPIVGDAEQWLNLIHVEDGAAAVVAAAERGKIGTIYNVSDGQPLRRRDFYEQLAKQLGAPPPRFVAPAQAVEQVNRRISNRLMREELGVVIQHKLEPAA